MTKSIFKYSAKDTYLILYTLVLGLVPFLLYNLDLSIAWLLLLPVHAWFITNLQNSPLHHHSHWPTFVNKKLNFGYELLLSMVGGIPHQTWKYSHLKHHIHVNDKPIHGQTKDPVSVFQKGQNGQVENFWKFSFGMTKLSLKNMIYFPKYNSKQVNNKKIIAEILCFDAYFLTFFILDFKLGLYMAVVYFLAFFLNGATSYGEHWGVLDRRGDTTQDSIGIYSTWYNIVGFGAGFHQEHHNSPGMHWTKLHTLTDKMHPDRVTRSGMHITNCPYWDHFKLLFKKQ